MFPCQILTSSILGKIYKHKNIYIKKSYINTKFKISAPTSTDKLELPDGSYSVSVIQNYFEYIIKAHETLTANRLDVNK